MNLSGSLFFIYSLVNHSQLTTLTLPEAAVLSLSFHYVSHPFPVSFLSLGFSCSADGEPRPSSTLPPQEEDADGEGPPGLTNITEQEGSWRFYWHVQRSFGHSENLSMSRAMLCFPSCTTISLHPLSLLYYSQVTATATITDSSEWSQKLFPFDQQVAWENRKL